MARFDHDVFISYAHLDDQTVESEEQGWVSRFDDEFRLRLTGALGVKARIWRDKKLRGLDIFSDEIEEQLSKSAMMISIVTPLYVNSEWCKREVDAFTNKAKNDIGETVGNKARVVRVTKRPVELEQLPEILREQTGYKFFVPNQEGGSALLLDPNFGEDIKSSFRKMVDIVASDVRDLLVAIENQTEGKAETVARSKGTVFLAECSNDMQMRRVALEQELKRHGFTVLPDKTLPYVEDEVRAATSESLAQADISVHLVGNSYGVIPDGDCGNSVVEIQNQIAVEQSKKTDMRRVVWLPNDLNPSQQKQQDFIQRLHTDSDAQLGADVITADFESLKITVFATLEEATRPQISAGNAASAEQSHKPSVYVVMTESDRKASLPLRKFLRDQGFDVAIPAFMGDACDIRAVHREFMSTCDGLLLFYGAGSESWKRTLQQDLRKLPAYRSGQPVLASFVYVAGPETDDKIDLIEFESGDVIDGLAAFSEPNMAEFLTAMKAPGVA